jgi:hypothetical protein
VAEMLLSAGALVNVFGPDNETPLHDAARSGCDMVKHIITYFEEQFLRV